MEEKTIPQPEVFLLKYEGYEDEKVSREAARIATRRLRGTKADPSESYYHDGIFKWSGLTYRFVIGNVYRELAGEDIRPINPKEREIALSKGIIQHNEGEIELLGLLVRSKTGYRRRAINYDLWNYLRKQVKYNFKDIDVDEPFLITGLMNVKKDDKFEDGLRFDVTELTEVYNIPILLKENDALGHYFDPADPNLKLIGFPSKFVSPKFDYTKKILLTDKLRHLDSYSHRNGVYVFSHQRRGYHTPNVSLDCGWIGGGDLYKSITGSSKFGGYGKKFSNIGVIHLIKNPQGNLEDMVSKKEPRLRRRIECGYNSTQ